MRVNDYIDIVSILQSALSNTAKPRYMSIAKKIESSILNSNIPSGAKLPPHRILADKIHVSIGTVSRAYTELEKIGLITTRVGDGSFVNDLTKIKKNIRDFRNILNPDPHVTDLSINMHISKRDIDQTSKTLNEISSDKKLLESLLSL